MTAPLEGLTTVADHADRAGVKRTTMHMRVYNAGIKPIVRVGHVGLYSVEELEAMPPTPLQGSPVSRDCSQCGATWSSMRLGTCPGCGVGKYQAFPEYRVGPRAQARALIELSHRHKEEYDALYGKFRETLLGEAGRSVV